MAKIRSDSLWSELTPEQRDLLFTWLVLENISYEKAEERILDQFQIETSKSALCTFLSKHAFGWKLQVAKQKAADKSLSLPADFEARKKQALAQREFEATFSDLSTKEIIAFKKLELDEQQLKLKQQDLELQRDKFRASIAKKIDLGLEDLYREIQKNPDAVELFNRMRGIITKEVAEA